MQKVWKRVYLSFASESMVFMICYICVIAGLPILIDPSAFAPTSIQNNYSDWLVRFWGADLVVGGTLGLVGLGNEHPRIERAGLALLFSGAGLYALVIVLTAGTASLLPGLTYALFVWACAQRFRKLGSVLRGINFASHLRKE